MRIAVLASGRGSNFQALLDAANSGESNGQFDGEFVGVFSDRPEAPVLQRAATAGIPAWSAAPAGFASRAEFDAALFSAITAIQPQLIVMAGYMRIVSEAHVAQWRGRMINIHPSLLPKYTGLRTHARVLAAGDAEHGATVHFVTAQLDGGPPIAQARIGVQPGDTTATLAQRVLGREHPLLVATVAAIAHGDIALADDSVLYRGRPLAMPLQLDAQGALQRTDGNPHPP